MGWSATASPITRLYQWRHGRDGIAEPEIEAAFVRASEEVIAQAGTVDGMLCRGGLHFRGAGDFLAKATGESVYPNDDEGWSPMLVLVLAETVGEHEWPEPDKAEDLWLLLSARKFLEACAALGLGIKFSW